MYYDVVVSIYEDENCNVRIDSYLLSGGFKTKDDAMEYINNNEINEYKYCYSNKEYPSIEIEKHNEDGSLVDIH